MARAVTELLNDGVDAAALAAAAGTGSGRGVTAPAAAAIAALEAGAVPRLAAAERNADLVAAAAGDRMTPAAFSFKVMQEVPLFVILVFQIVQPLAATHLAPTMEAMVAFLTLLSVADARCLARGIVPSTASTPPSGADAAAMTAQAASEERLRASRNADFVLAQAKTLSFMAYLLRNPSISTTYVKPHEAPIAAAILRVVS
jgi:hypothetical protein